MTSKLNLNQRLTALENALPPYPAGFAHDVASDVVKIYYSELTGSDAQAKTDEIAAEILTKGVKKWISDAYDDA